MAESPHSPGTTTQLSGARSTTELIARRASLPLGARYAKSERNPIPLFPFFAPMSPNGGAWGRKKGDPINLFRPRIISSWAWSYFTVEKRKKTSISKFNSDVAPFFWGVKQCQTKIPNKH